MTKLDKGRLWGGWTTCLWPTGSSGGLHAAPFPASFVWSALLGTLVSFAPSYLPSSVLDRVSWGSWGQCQRDKARYLHLTTVSLPPDFRATKHLVTQASWVCFSRWGSCWPPLFSVSASPHPFPPPSRDEVQVFGFPLGRRAQRTGAEV